MSSEQIDHPNPYAAPEANVADAVPDLDMFYVISARKFALLFFATLGVYQVYWFYRHWQQYRLRTGERLLPVVRALFSIFFTHSLARRIDDGIRRGTRHVRWSPSVVATLFVILQILSNGLDRMAARSIGSPTTDVLSLLILLPVGWTLWSIQSAANTACQDPDGAGNARLSAANHAWIVFGLLWWALVCFGLFLPDDIPADLPGGDDATPAS